MPFEPPQNAQGCFRGVMVNGKTVGANLASIMDGLGPVDVELGSVVSLGYNQNGERDVVQTRRRPIGRNCYESDAGPSPGGGSPFSFWQFEHPYNILIISILGGT
jgi:hypothetical protein